MGGGVIAVLTLHWQEPLQPVTPAIVFRLESSVNAIIGTKWGKGPQPKSAQQIKVLSESDEQFVVLPDNGPVAAKNVALELVFAQDDVRPTNDHLVKVGSTWRWVMTQAVLSQFHDGGCPR